MPIQLQKLDKEMYLKHHRHKTPVLFLGVQVSAAETLPTHISQHLRAQLGPGAEAAELLWNWAIVFCCIGVPSEVLHLQLHKQIPRSDLKDHALTLAKNLLLFATVFVCPLYREETKETSCTELPSSSGEKTVSARTGYCSVTASQGGSSPVLPGRKKKKAFFLAPSRSRVWNTNYTSIVLSCIASDWLPRWSFSPPFLALLKFCSIQIGFTKGFFSSVHAIIFYLGTLLIISEILEVLLSCHISDVHYDMLRVP